MKRLLVAAVLAALTTLAAKPPTGLAPSGHSEGGPGYYIRATDAVLGPCHVTDDFEFASWSGTLAPGESFSAAEWFCGPDDAYVLPGYLNEGSDEDFGFDLYGRGDLAATLTLETPDRGLEQLAVWEVPDKATHLHGCAFAAYRERYDSNNVTYYQRGYLRLTVTNVGPRLARDIALSYNIELAGSPRIVPYC